MIQNYDTNGLIFALNPDSVDHDIRSPIYLEAIKNILDANKFDCIPLVDKRRERLNQNNLTNRAIYKKDVGVVTHIARRALYEDEDEIVITRIENITNVSNTTELIKALIQFFDVKNSGDRCHFIISVGGTEDEPEALFTMSQLKQERTLRELFGRMFIETFDKRTKIDFDIDKVVKDIYNVIIKSDKNLKLNWSDLFSSLKSIRISLSKVKTKNVSRYRQTSSDFISSSNDIRDLKIKDVMTKVACGVNWSFGEDGTPSVGTDSEILAKHLVCEANNFTNLVIYKDGVLIPNYSISKNIKKPKTSICRNTDDNYAQLMIDINDTNENDFSVVVLPNENYHTSEGPMEWPGIITANDIKEHNLLIAYTSICVSIEDTLRSGVLKSSKNLRYQKLDWTGSEQVSSPDYNANYGKVIPGIKYQSADAGIGTLAKYFRGEDARKDAEERGQGINRIYKPKQTFEEKFNTGVSRANYKLTWVADMRNVLAHEAISMKPKNVLNEIICLEKIKWMYELADGLKLLKEI